MAAKKFKVKLEGKDPFEYPVIRVADTKTDISSSDGGITWTGEILLSIPSEEMKIYLSCKAQSDTEWSFSVTDTESGKKIYTAEGYTGEKLASRGGIRIANFSERDVTVKL